MIRSRPAGDAALLLDAVRDEQPARAATSIPSVDAGTDERPAGPATSGPTVNVDPDEQPTGPATSAWSNDAGAAARLAAAVRAARLRGVTDVVPGARTVLVITEPGSRDLAELARVIDGLPLPAATAGQELITEIPVVYDGPDLLDVAELTGMPAAEVIARHCAAEYTVGWLGFAPGFGYLTGLDPALSDVPRLASPRLSVPPGSVAIAGGLAAVYPAASPGGWRLLGRTSARLWDPDRVPPSLLAPGRRVRFRAVPADQLTAAPHTTTPQATIPQATIPQATDQQATAAPPDAAPQDAVEPTAAPAAAEQQASRRLRPRSGTRSLEVIRPGPLATVQDLGRPGLGDLGVPPSGAADAASLRLANWLVGNPADAAGLELTLGRAAFRCLGGARLAVTGAPAQVTIAAGNGEPAGDVPFSASFSAPDGALVGIGSVTTGLRTYLAVAGGFDVPAVLGSRSSDLLSGLGGGPLRPGDVLPIGEPKVAEAATLPARTTFPTGGETASLRLVPGPRLDWFGPDALTILCRASYAVTAASNRTGLRLAGPALPRADRAELASEGMVSGALQVPHDGLPILLLADHPTVGGYPVIAVVVSVDIGLAGQLRPGSQVRFRIGD